jgi:RNase P subunit RPR2
MMAHQCQYCPASFKSANKMNEHARKEHNNDIQQNWFSCPKCKKLFPTKNSRLGHKRTNCLGCEHCKMLLTTTSQLRNHMEQNHLEEMSQLWKQCSACDKKFRVGASFRKHSDQCRHKKIECQVDVVLFRNF